MLVHLELSVDHYQFYLEDETSQADTSEVWNESTSANMLVVAPGLIGIGTARYGGKISVDIEVRDARLDEDFSAWDQVAECSVDVPSGCIVVSSPETDFSEAPRIYVAPGTYQALIFYGNLDDVYDENALQGDDRYRIVLWPGHFTIPRILKRHGSNHP